MAVTSTSTRWKAAGQFLLLYTIAIAVGTAASFTVEHFEQRAAEYRAAVSTIDDGARTYWRLVDDVTAAHAGVTGAAEVLTSRSRTVAEAGDKITLLDKKSVTAAADAAVAGTKLADESSPMNPLNPKFTVPSSDGASFEDAIEIGRAHV